MLGVFEVHMLGVCLKLMRFVTLHRISTPSMWQVLAGKFLFCDSDQNLSLGSSFCNLSKS